MIPHCWAAAAFLVANAVLIPARVGAGPDQVTEGRCVRYDRWGNCVQTVSLTVSTPPEPEPKPVGDGGGPAPPLPECRWRSIPTYHVLEVWVGPPPATFAEPVLQWYSCTATATVSPNLGPPVALRWVDGGAPVEPGPPPADAIAALLLARVEALMVAPTVVTDPPSGSPAIVRLPAFVEVTNWQGEIVDEECVLGLCVTMTATPRLSFSPGEPGSGEIACSPPGTRFDSGGPPAAVQASAPGACAWAYQLRSGVGDRPAEWPAEVTVAWTVTWTATDGSEGSFPELSFATAVPMTVDEVQTVVTDDE